MNAGFKDGYDSFVKTSGGGKAYAGASYVRKVEEAISNVQEAINQFHGYETGTGQLKGDIAEFWHSGTHNVDAAVKGLKAFTKVDRSHEFASPDITSNFGKHYQSKYYKTGEQSALEQAKSYLEHNRGEESVNNPHDPIYRGQERIVPADQLESARIKLEQKIAKEAVTRPEQVPRYKDTLDNLTDRIKSPGGSESTPAAGAEMEQAAREGKEGVFDAAAWGLTTEERIHFENIVKQSLKAGLSAAAISMVLALAPELIKLIAKAINDERIKADDLKRLGFSGLKGGAEGFIRGSVAAGLTAACKSGRLGASLQSAGPEVIGAVTVITFNVIQNSFKLAGGKITKAEFADACMRDLFVTLCSSAGGALGQGLIPVPALGYLLGSFLGGIAGAFVYNSGHEAFLSFCCESGFTFFGLVEQNYELPKEVLQEIGLNVFEYKQFQHKKFEYNRFEYKKFEPKTIDIKRIDVTFLRRGVIGVNKIGYVS